MTLLSRSAAFVVMVFLFAPVVASAQTTDAQVTSLMAQIQALQAQIIQVQGQVTPISASAPTTLTTPLPPQPGTCVNVTHNMRLASTDAKTGGDVTRLQDYLIANGYLNTTASGYYGALTLSAVGKLQLSLGIVTISSDPNYGYMGPRTRGAIACNSGGSLSTIPSSGRAPLTVNFTAAGDPANYSIDFGDGTRAISPCLSEGCTPGWTTSHTYGIPGTYTTKLSKSGQVVGRASVVVTSSDITQSKAIIDPRSLSTTSLQPVIYGTASNTNTVGLSISYAGGKFDGTGMISVVNGKWSVTLNNQTYMPGIYGIDVYDGSNKLLTAGTLRVGLTSDQVQMQDNVVGTGAEALPGSKVSVTYVGTLPNGVVFDSTAMHSNQPLVFTLGDGSVIPGFEIGVNGMKVGGERTVIIPPSLGYGSTDVKDSSGNVLIPANSTLIFNIKLVSVSTGPILSDSTLAVSTDASSPGYQIVPGGLGGATLGVYKFRATGEDISVNRVGLQASSGTLSTAVSQIRLYDSSGNFLGSGVVLGTNTSASVDLSTPLLVQKDTDTQLVVMGDIALIGVEYEAVPGELLKVDLDTATVQTRGIGASSGATILATGSTNVAGVRIFKSFPMIAHDPLPTTGLNNGKLIRFKLTANTAGSIGLDGFKFNVVPSGVSIGTITLYAYTDANYSQPIPGFSGGEIGHTGVLMGNFITPTPTQVLQVPAGVTYYFELRGALSNMQSNATVSTTLLGDSIHHPLSVLQGVYNDSNFVWTPNDLKMSGPNDVDWTNGYGLMGLVPAGFTQTLTGSGTTIIPAAALTANGMNEITIVPGASIQYAWSGSNGVSAKSSYVVDSADTCPLSAGGIEFTLPVTSGKGTYTAGPVAYCRAGHTYTVTYTVRGSSGQIASAKVIVHVTSVSETINFTASPNPCVFASGQTACTSTLTWTIPTGVTAQTWVYVPGSVPALLDCNVGPQTITKPISWITSTGATFKIYRANSCDPSGIAGKTASASITVKGTAGTASVSANTAAAYTAAQTILQQLLLVLQKMGQQ